MSDIVYDYRIECRTSRGWSTFQNIDTVLEDYARQEYQRVVEAEQSYVASPYRFRQFRLARSPRPVQRVWETVEDAKEEVKP